MSLAEYFEYPGFYEPLIYYCIQADESGVLNLILTVSRKARSWVFNTRITSKTGLTASLFTTFTRELCGANVKISPHCIFYHRNGVAHREDGPAIITLSSNGKKIDFRWYIEGSSVPVYKIPKIRDELSDRTWCIFTEPTQSWFAVPKFFLGNYRLILEYNDIYTPDLFHYYKTLARMQHERGLRVLPHDGGMGSGHSNKRKELCQ